MNGSASPEPQWEAQPSGGSKKNPNRFKVETALALKKKKQKKNLKAEESAMIFFLFITSQFNILFVKNRF